MAFRLDVTPAYLNGGRGSSVRYPRPYYGSPQYRSLCGLVSCLSVCVIKYKADMDGWSAVNETWLSSLYFHWCGRHGVSISHSTAEWYPNNQVIKLARHGCRVRPARLCMDALSETNWNFWVSLTDLDKLF